MLKKVRDRMIDSSGVSIIFVLCVMLLLFIVGTSALVAASTAAGTSAAAKNDEQINLYADSVMETFTKDLLDTNEDKNGMGNQIVQYVYDFGIKKIELECGGDVSTGAPDNDDIIGAIPTNFAITYGGVTLGEDSGKNCIIQIRLEDLKFIFTPPIPETPENRDDPDNIIPAIDRVHSNTTIRFKLVAEVELEFAGKTMKKQAEYQFNRTEIKDYEVDNYTSNPTFTYGNRELKKYGKKN